MDGSISVGCGCKHDVNEYMNQAVDDACRIKVHTMPSSCLHDGVEGVGFNVDATCLAAVDAEHPHLLLAGLLLLEEFTFSADVTSVALCQDVFAVRFDGFARDDAVGSRGLDGDVKLLSGNLVF